MAPDERSVPNESAAEMAANYPYFRQFVYAKLREELERSVPELPDEDLETYAKAQGAGPLEDFIEEIARLAAGR